MHASEEVVVNPVPLVDLSGLDLALAGAAAAPLAEAVKHLRPADLGRDLSRRSIADGQRVLAALDDRHAAAMLLAAHPSTAGRLLAEADGDRAHRVLAFLPVEHQVELLATLKPDQREAIQATLPADERATVARLLAYPPQAVGRIMNPKVWRATLGQTVGDAMAVLHDTCADVEVAANLYVVDGTNKLVGVAALREVAIAPPAQLLADLMVGTPIAVREDAGRGDAAAIIRTHDFLSVPVVDAAGKLVGAVRVDDLLDSVLARVGTGFLNQGGVDGTKAASVPYFQTNLFHVVRSRLTWLILLFVAETATGTVLRYFESELAKVVALSFFVPLLIGTGGNAGSQTVSTVIRALAIGEVRVRDVWRVVAREVTAGLLLGVLLGVIAFGRALLWGVGYDLAACVSITILVVCTWANAVGAAIPLVAQKLGIDPTVVSAPLITTLVDASGLFIYFSVAHVMLAQLH